MIIGHRGAMGHIAENTIPSIKKAMELGVDGIEIDVFKCKTGELVVFHDEKLERLTNSSGLIESLDLDSIKNIIVLDKYRIPTLEEVLELIDGQVKLNIELKGYGTASPTNNLINQYINNGRWTEDEFIISSFKWGELEKIRELNTTIPIAVLVNSNVNPIDALPFAKKVKAIAVNPYFKDLNQENIQEIHSNGFKVFPYTVNELDDIERMVKLGVDAIITDYPERFNK
ncbi:MAG: glycerophosphodiester phosphodiesterase [Bacteroidota bacterium]|nr:glycerophosphodiester phosphodiesterase [Bacteroidota bacterium]